MRPYILITNDDGAEANGIAVLTRLMMQLGDVVVVVPDGPRSGQSNALTVNQPIRFKKVDQIEGFSRYICSGTPTDCVKLALNEIVERKPDILVSGINHGSNAAINVIYSGTMGAVLEGCENGIPSIGFSINSHSLAVEFEQFEPFVISVTKQVLKKGLPHGICLNVNAPVGNIEGIRISKQCDGRWVKEYEKYFDPQGRPYFWLTGHFENHEPQSEDTDEWAVANGYVAIVPVKIDMTDYQWLEEMKNWKFE